MTTTTQPTVPAEPPGLRAPAVDHLDASRHASLANWWSDTLVFAGRNIEHIRQIPEKLLDVTIQPLMFVLLFAYVFGGAITVGSGGNYREYLIGGILIQTLAFGLTGPATAISTDLSEGVIDRFRSLPAKRSAYLAGHYVAEMAGMALSIAVLLTAGFIVGWRLHADVFHVAGAGLLLFMFCSAMIWVGTWVGLTVRATDAVMGVGFVVVFPLTFLSNAFVPINSMPTALQWVAAWNPVSVVVQATREMFGNPTLPITNHTWPLDHAQLAAFLYCALILVIAVPAAMRRYRARTSD
jgi:ABC transporter DrrB family efflux protein